MESTVGILGGGQLGRMLTEAANRLNVKVATLDTEDSPAKQVNATPAHVAGSCKDPESIRSLAKQCDVITFEIEHVNTQVLEEIATESPANGGGSFEEANVVEIQPSWKTIRIIQDKYDQKEYLGKYGIATARSIPIENASVQALQAAGKKLDYPYMLKSRTDAYDGRGNHPVNGHSECDVALKILHHRPVYAEQWATFRMELAVMVVKTANDARRDWRDVTLAFPVVETIHQDSICKLVYAPARSIACATAQEAQDLARRAVATFEGKGIFGVEMFLLQDGSLLVNEIAPRPHNSGHYTMEACSLSQYDAHLRAILGLPIPMASLQMLTEKTCAVMINILGGASAESHLRAAREALSISGARIHLYGKGHGRPGRKMGHVTILADSIDEIEARISPLMKIIDEIRDEYTKSSYSWQPLDSAKIRLNERAAQRHQTPIIAITMGSDSDRSVLTDGIQLLKEFEIPHSVSITSAHRTPQRMIQFARNAAIKGTKVIIAAAGGAAHLPGMIAANTSLPVIGIPVKASHLEGLDSLLSIVQMPRGCPVASVAINNSVNAAQLAIRILSIDDTDIRTKLEQYLDNQTRSVEEKASRMEIEGFDAYCKNA